MLFKVGFFCLFSFSLFSMEEVYLKTPIISHQEIVGTAVGVRPYRQTGVRIEAERIQNKLIIHNYGYGGSGLTLSFGGANEVLDILENQQISSGRIAILGAGAAGLTTAYDLLAKGFEVHLYSEDWHPHLTSNVAAGIWTPLTSPSELPLEKREHHQRLLDIAERRFLKSTGNNPEFAGIKKMHCYKLIKDSSQEPAKKAHEEEVIAHFDNGLIRNARRTNRVAIDGLIFMDDLYNKVISHGAKLHQMRFENITEVMNLEEPVIVNCMSMGSRDIFNDQDFIPARGQLIYFKTQEIDYFLFQAIPDSNYFFMIYPWSDRLILGGVYEYDEEELSIKPEVIEEIIQNGVKCLSLD